MIKTKTLVKTAQEAHEMVEAAALKAAQRNETMDALKPGEFIHQGDVYLVALESGSVIPKQSKAWSDGRKLAPGNNPGARHVIDPDADVGVWDVDMTAEVRLLHPKMGDHALPGPVVHARTSWTLMHPEHGHKTCPAGLYQVMYQVDAVTMRRVMD